MMTSFLLGIFLVGMSCEASGKIPDATSIVPADDSVYLLLEKLQITDDLVHSILDQNNLSEREVYRLLKSAKFRMSPDSSLYAWVSDELRRLTDRLCGGNSFHTPESIRFYFDSSNSARPIRNNGLGSTTGTYDSLHSHENGARFFNGRQLSAQTAVTAQAGGFFAARIEPRFESEWMSSAHQSEIFLRRANFNFTFRNVELVIGRDDWRWGPIPEGGLLAGTSARPIDQLRLSSSRPFRFPGFFRHVGPMKYSVFFANTGPHRVNDYSWIFGWKANIAPSRFFEFGFGRSMIFGGKNAPRVSTVNFFREAFSKPKNFGDKSKGESRGTNTTDQRWNLDFKVRIPVGVPFNWYNEFAVDDSRNALFLSFKNFKYYVQDQVAVKSGLFFPQIFDGRLSMRIEYLKIPAIFYRHSIWRDGYILSGGNIGGTFGSDSRSGKLAFEWAASRFRSLSASFAYVLRTGDNYKQFDPAPGGIKRVTVVTNRPNEHAYIIESNARWELSSSWIARADLGLELARNYEFEADRNRTLYRLGSGLEFKF